MDPPSQRNAPKRKKGYFLTTSKKSKRYQSDRNIDSEIFPQIECSSSEMEDENEIQTTEPSLDLPSQQCTQSTKNKSTQCKVSKKSTYVQASVNTKTKYSQIYIRKRTFRSSSMQTLKLKESVTKPTCGEILKNSPVRAEVV